MIFVDSNIWCYYFTKDAKEHERVAKYINGILQKERILMNSLIVMEVVHYLIKNFGPVKGKEVSDHFLSFPFVVEDFAYEDLRSAVTILAEHSHTGIGGRDATILATMTRRGTTKLVTHDQAFKKVRGVDVIDPC